MSFYHLIHGDCSTVLQTLKTDSVDLILTDPPWSIGKKDYDHQDPVVFDSWLKSIALQFKRVLKPNHSLLLEVSKVRLYEFMSIFHNIFKFKQPIVCYVNNQIGHKCPVGWSLYSLTLWYGKGKVKPVKKYRDLIEVPLISTKNQGWTYPNPKIISFYEKLVEMFSEPNDVVLDAFMGSGTTMIACQNLRRNCIGIEIDEDFCEVAKKRCFGKQFLDRKTEYKFERSPALQ